MDSFRKAIRLAVWCLAGNCLARLPSLDTLTEPRGFDTLSWRELPTSDLSMPTGTDMLPLIVGKPAGARPSEEAASAKGDAPIEEEAVIIEATSEEAKV